MGPGPRFVKKKKNLPGRGLTKVEKYCARGYWKLKQEAVDRTLWRTGCGRGCGLVVRQTTD